MIANNVVNEIKYRTDIEKLIGEYVALKRRGTTLVGLCPFHSEKTPSFTVWPQKGSYHCFGCGAGGDAITFIEQIEGLSYPEALRFLAKRVGVEITEDERTAEEGRRRLRLLELNRFAAHYFHDRLSTPAGAEALAYLKRRRISDRTIARFGIGYAPDEWRGLLPAAKAAGYSEQELIDCFLASRKKDNTFDLFRGRVMFPIIDAAGSVIAFGGRVLDDSVPKYINTSDTPVFHKSRNLFALNYAKKTKADHFILAEGYMDVISLHQAGFDQAVATLGTALTPDQARLIARYTSNVVLAYDSDAAGQNATKRAYGLLREAGLSVRVLQMTGAKDPDEYIKTFGREKFSGLLGDSSDALSFRIQTITAGYDLAQADQKVKCLQEIAGELAGLDSELEIDVYCDKVAAQTGVAASALKAEVKRKIRAKNRRKTADEVRKTGAPREFVPGGAPAGDPFLDRTCRGILRYIYDHPEDCARVCALLPEGRLPDPLWDRVLTSFREQAQYANIDIGALNAELTVQEMGRVSALLASEPPCRDMTEVGQYTAALAARQQNTLVGDEGTAEVEQYLEQLARQKQ